MFALFSVYLPRTLKILLIGAASTCLKAGLRPTHPFDLLAPQVALLSLYSPSFANVGVLLAVSQTLDGGKTSLLYRLTVREKNQMCSTEPCPSASIWHTHQYSITRFQELSQAYQGPSSLNAAHQDGNRDKKQTHANPLLPCFAPPERCLPRAARSYYFKRPCT